MGIIKLMDFLNKKCPQTIKMITQKDYSNKTLTIDASNLIYRYLIKTQSIVNA